MLKTTCLISLTLLSLCSYCFSYDNMTVPELSLFGENLFADNGSKLLFINHSSSRQSWGLCAVDLKAKSEIAIKDDKCLMMLAVYSMPKGIFVKYDKSKSEYLSILGRGYKENVVRTFSLIDCTHDYPMVSPNGDHVALIEHTLLGKRFALTIMNFNGAGVRNVTVLLEDETLPTFMWDDDSRRLYFTKSSANGTGFHVYNIDNSKAETIHEEPNIKVDYVYPKFLERRYMLFLGRNVSGKLLLGKYDLKLSSCALRPIDAEVGYGFATSIAELPGGLFVCQATKAVEKKNELDKLIELDKLNKIVLFRNSLEIAKVFDIDSQHLTPIAYSRILGKMLFIRNERELIGVDFGGQVNIETIFKKSQYK